MQKGGFDTQWELDLFGKTRSQFRGVRARWQAKVALLEDMKHTMLFELMRAIVAWRQAQETLEETKDLLTTQDKQIALFTQRSQAGLIDATFLLRAQAERAHTSTHLPLAQAEADRARYSIARLLAMPADQLELEDARHGSFHLPSVDRVVSVDAEILRERPDVRALRAQMLAAQSDLKAAEADLWPRLSVGAFFGVQHGSDGVKLASNPIWSLASSLTFPILDFGRLRGAVDVANARARAASLEYENGVLLALQEVQTALSDYLNGINAVACQEKTHRFRKDTVKLASDRFAQGLTDMTDLTTAQSELNQATIQLIDQRALAATAYIRLQKALGVSHRLSAPKETP
jgi:outer membrane protein TolC